MLGVADDRYTEHEHTYAKWCSLLANDEDGLYTSRSPKGRPFAEASQWPPLCRSSQQCERKLGMATPISRGKEG